MVSLHCSSLWIAYGVDQFWLWWAWCVFQSLLKQWRRWDRVGSCNLQLHCQSVCDWHVYCSVQSLETTVLTPNCFCVMSLYLSRIAHVELEELMRQSLIVHTTAL